MKPIQAHHCQSSGAGNGSHSGTPAAFLMPLVSLFLFSCFLLPASGFSEPERLPIKLEEQKTREHLAKQNLRHIDVNRIQDPEARKAIREIMRYLKLEKE